MNEVLNGLKELNLLYAEDNPTIQETTKRTLDLLFHHVYTAKDGLEALEIYKTNKIDIALLDYIMPNMDGLTLVKEIDSLDEVNIPIIVATGYSDEIENKESFERLRGKVWFIGKPLKYDEFLKTIQEVIATSK
jgi:CheY-like chemotaxis protein